MSTSRPFPTALQLEEFPQPELWHLKYPVLLCHGFGAFASVFNPSPLHEAAMLLRNHGIKAIAPNIVPYATIEVRAAAWLKLIARILQNIPETKLHIVAHSMAGLDLRYALNRVDVAPYIQSFITIATPHRGSPLADMALEAPDNLRDRIVRLTNMLGSKFYPEIESDAFGALYQLTPDYVEHQFNTRYPDVTNIPFYCVSASCGLGTDRDMGISLQFFNRYIYDREGENDGFVSTQSSTGCGQHMAHSQLSHYEQTRLFLNSKDEDHWQELWKMVYLKLKECEAPEKTRQHR